MLRLGQHAQDSKGSIWIITCLSTDVITIQNKFTKEFVDVLRKDLEKGKLIPISTLSVEEIKEHMLG